MKLNDEQKATIWTKLAEVLGHKVAVALSDYQAKDGTTISVNDDTLEVTGSDEVDGEIILSDGRTLVLKEGKLETIKDAPQEAPVVELAEEAPELTALKAENEALKAQVAALVLEKEQAQTAATDLTTKLSALEKLPADKKVALISQPIVIPTAAEQAWQRYQNTK